MEKWTTDKAEGGYYKVLIEICGDYFNVNDIRHIWVESNSSIVVEVMSGEEYFLDYTPYASKNNISPHQYLKQIIDGINIVSGRVR